MNLWRQLKQLLLRYDRSLLLASGLSAAFFLYVAADYWRSGGTAVATVVRFAVAATLLFVLLFGIIRVLVADIRREVRREEAEPEALPGEQRSLFAFAVYKALVRCVVGVSLLLGWLAGLFAILERFHGAGAPVAGLLLAAVYSLGMFLLAFGFVHVMEQVRFPRDE